MIYFLKCFRLDMLGFFCVSHFNLVVPTVIMEKVQSWQITSSTKNVQNFNSLPLYDKNMHYIPLIKGHGKICKALKIKKTTNLITC